MYCQVYICKVSAHIYLPTYLPIHTVIVYVRTFFLEIILVYGRVYVCVCVPVERKIGAAFSPAVSIVTSYHICLPCQGFKLWRQPDRKVVVVVAAAAADCFVQRVLQKFHIYCVRAHTPRVLVVWMMKFNSSKGCWVWSLYKFNDKLCENCIVYVCMAERMALGCGGVKWVRKSGPNVVYMPPCVGLFCCCSCWTLPSWATMHNFFVPFDVPNVRETKTWACSASHRSTIQFNYPRQGNPIEMVIICDGTSVPLGMRSQVYFNLIYKLLLNFTREIKSFMMISPYTNIFTEGIGKYTAHYRKTWWKIKRVCILLPHNPLVLSTWWNISTVQSFWLCLTFD